MSTKLKCCRTCRRAKLVTEFTRCGQGYRRDCDACLGKAKPAIASPPPSEKACRCCHEVKPLNAFNRNAPRPDGHASQCKACDKAKRQAQIEKTRESCRQSYARHIERRRADCRADKERRRQSPDWPDALGRILERRRGDPKDRARIAVFKAVQSGKLVKPTTCPSCHQPTTSRRMHAHHDDYERPLEVRWLCSGCHGDEHRALNQEHRTSAARQ